MSYASARKIVIRSGFQAPVLPPNGYSKDDEKVVAECKGDVDLCTDFPEIASCSGQGHCNMNFTDAYGNKLTVTTFGEEPSASKVIAFEISCSSR